MGAVTEYHCMKSIPLLVGVVNQLVQFGGQGFHVGTRPRQLLSEDTEILADFVYPGNVHHVVNLKLGSILRRRHLVVWLI